MVEAVNPLLGGADVPIGLRQAALNIVGGHTGALRLGLQCGDRASVQSGQLGAQCGQRSLGFRQPRQFRQAVLQLDEVPHAVAGQAQPLFETGKLSGQRRQLGADRGQPHLALRDLAGDGAAADEPAAVVPRVKVAGAELAAHETLASCRLALITQFFEGLALNVTIQKEVYVGAGDRVVGLDLGGQPIRTGGANLAAAHWPPGCARRRAGPRRASHP